MLLFYASDVASIEALDQSITMDLIVALHLHLSVGVCGMTPLEVILFNKLR